MEDEPLTIDAALCHQTAVDLQQQGRAAEAETFYRAALSLAPDRPDSWANLGLAVLRTGRPEDAVLCERESLRLDPENPEAHNTLGIALHALGGLAEAENHFRGALRLHPGHANATLNLGVIRQSLGDPYEAERLYRRSRELGADAARACNNLALALAEQNRLAEAEGASRDALAAAKDYPEARVNLGMILLARGHLTEGWRYYEARWRVPPLRHESRLPDETRWTGAEPVEGKTILLWAEQGFGDTLQFCRYVPVLAARGARVILEVPRPLLPLMDTLPGVDRVIATDSKPPDFDAHCPLMSLPLALGTTVETIPWRVPYLAADPASIATWQAIIPAGERRIGLVWAGGRRPGQAHAAAIDRRRSVKLADMTPLGAVPGCVFVSLQLGPPAEQADTSPFPLVDFTARMTDFADTAALIETLDLVISVDTAVAHLAGALGKPVWLLSRYDACWRWMEGRDDTPWYPTMRLFRQTAPGDWASVIARVAEALPGFRTID